MVPLLAVFFLGLGACSQAKEALSVGDRKQKNTPEPYTYSDRELWQALSQFDYDFADENLTVHAVEPARDGVTQLFLFVGETATPNNGDALVMRHLAERNPSAAIWYIDTPDAFFLPRERIGMRNSDGAFMLPILQQVSQDFSRISVITMDVLSVPLLRGIRQWQSRASTEQLDRLRHVVLLYPSLYINTPVAGQPRELFPVAYQTELPISIIQPELGAQANAIDETRDALAQGGSLVQLERLANATDGIFKYQDIRQMAERGAELIDRSEKQMSQRVAQAGFQVRSKPVMDFRSTPRSTIVAGLIPWEAAVPMPEIELKDLDGHRVNVREEYAGKALLLTFWATWCPHCVEEIPSMNRALAQLDSQRFAIVSVSYKDSEAVMRQFMRQTPIHFPVLMDHDGAISEAWKIYSFPSSFLIDREGRIQSSINTGAIWDSPDMLEALRAISR